MRHGRWPNGWSVIDVVRWFESNFDFLHRSSENAALRFGRRFGSDDAPAAAANNLPEADQAVPDAWLDKRVADMLGTLKSSAYLEGNLDNACGSDPAFAALLDAHHGTRYVHGSLSAPSSASDLVPQGRKDDLGAGLGSVSAGAFILGDKDAGHGPGQDFIFPPGNLPPADLGPPPVI